jgi:hypothetical protein
MTRLSPSGKESETLRLLDLAPYFSITVLQCAGADPAVDFDTLVRFVRRSVDSIGRASGVDVRSEVKLSAQDVVEDWGTLRELGFDGLYGVSREVRRPPGWVYHDAGLIDVVNELVIVVRRNNLVAICGPSPSDAQLRKWIHREAAPFRFLPTDVLAGTFHGDGKMIWMRGVHRRRSSKADSKAMGGIRIQDALNPIEDGTYTLSAAKVDFQPEDDALMLRDQLTVSPEKSRISWKRTYLTAFLAATIEAFEMLEKALVAPDDPEPVFKDVAVNEKDLSRVRGAFDILVTDPDVLRGDPSAGDDQLERAELLLDALLDVRGDPDSAVAKVDVGYNGALAGTLTIGPVSVPGGGFDLEVRISGTVSHEAVVREIRDAIDDGGVLTVYYQSGHVFTGHQIARQPLGSRPFHNIDFEDFTGFEITREKPKIKAGKSLHESIAIDGDDSLFAWVVRKYAKGWLFCDDGAGEVADFLHLSDDGTLTVIHVKAAGKRTTDRRIAVTRFEQVVSQAEKNVMYLDNDALVERLEGPRATGAAAWRDGRRVPGTTFVDQLRMRVASDKTHVVIVQPHLLQTVHEQARKAANTGKPNRDSYSLMLLDDLLHSTRLTIASRCDDLRVFGCA